MRHFGLVISILVLQACSTSKFVVQSEPEGVQVNYFDSEKKERKVLGTTPLELETDKIIEEHGALGEPGSFVEIEFTKENFATKKLMVPLSPNGSLDSELRVKLESDEKKIEEITSAQKALDLVFVAQKFARLKQFERALIELDKVLESFPKFSTALAMKGAIYYAQANFKESLQWYEKALEQSPDSPQMIEMVSKVRKNLRLPASNTIKVSP